MRVSGSFLANDSAAARLACRAGHDITLLPEIQLIDDLRAGRLSLEISTLLAAGAKVPT